MTQSRTEPTVGTSVTTGTFGISLPKFRLKNKFLMFGTEAEKQILIPSENLPIFITFRHEEIENLIKLPSVLFIKFLLSFLEFIYIKL